MKVKVVGRPGKIIDHGPFIITSMLAPQKSPTLPKGLPPLPASKLVYLIYVAQRQWKKVAKAIQNPEDILILEGWLSYDKELKRMTIFTQSATTKMLEKARREEQKAKAEAEAKKLKEQEGSQ